MQKKQGIDNLIMAKHIEVEILGGYHSIQKLYYWRFFLHVSKLLSKIGLASEAKE